MSTVSNYIGHVEKVERESETFFDMNAIILIIKTTNDTVITRMI